MEIIHDWTQTGFLYIQPSHYLDQASQASLKNLNKLYESDLKADGPRNRAYLKLQWSRIDGSVKISENQNYFQTAASNNLDGGKLRQFAQINTDIIHVPIMQNILKKNISIIENYPPLSNYNELTFGIHFIQYKAQSGSASYSSPVGLHIDDEPLVFVHLLTLSQHALGGDNLIAELESQEIKHVLRLEQPMDTLLVNRNCYHAVTPLGSKQGTARRNIILFTIEPDTTQMAN